ncbi:MAG: DNA replication and repair protein RecF, partial [Bacillota bacterium]|nr:DNA replication and repair protein RecF [Bacillota bacterium]
MIIEKLELENYRNFEKETVLLNPEVNVIRGMNAQGKTNFLEAIYLFSSAKSHRPVGEKDLIRFGQDSLKIKMDFRSGDIPLHGEINISQDEKRKIAFNGIPVKKNMLLSEYFKTVLFTPEDLEIIKGEKELRRNLLDDAICILKPNYAHILKDYNKCIKQKNSLLKSENISNLIPTIDIWNQRLCEYGARLVMYRDSFSKLLEKYCCQNMLDLTSGAE